MNSEKGNVFFYILIGVMLFAALGYAVSSSTRGRTSLDKERADILATEIIAYGNTINNAVKTVMAINNCTEKQISFEDNNSTSKTVAGTLYTYTNPNAPTDKSCHIFSIAGGGVTPRLLPPEASYDPSEIVVTSRLHPNSWSVNSLRVLGNGSDATTEAGSDLVLILARGLKIEVCDAINAKLGVSYLGDPFTATPFIGEYVGQADPIGDSASGVGAVSKRSFCVNSDSATKYNRNYIQVLIAR